MLDVTRKGDDASSRSSTPCALGHIDGHVVVVISNNSESGALRRAAAAGMETCHVSSLTHPNADSLDAAICDALQRARADVIFLAG